MHEKHWFIERFDSYVAGEGGQGAVLEKSRDSVAHAYASAVEAGEIDRRQPELVEEGRELFDRFIKPVRSQRRQSMLATVEDLLDALADRTILGADDPILRMSFPLGDGRDKQLNAWTRDDWSGAITERYRNAASVTSAAADFDAATQHIIDAFRQQDVRITGDLFTESPS